MIVVDHDMHFVRMLGGTVTVLHQGSILVEGDADAVLTDSRVREVYPRESGGVRRHPHEHALAEAVPHAGNAAAAGAPDLVLDVAELRAAYGHVPVLHGVNLQLHEGEAIGIVGHNGMGKTTLLKTLIGLLPASGGRISVDGVDVTRAPAHERSRMGIGYVPQGRGILPGLSALENLRLAWSADTGETEEHAVQRVLDTFPRLNSVLEQRGGTLSGGEQQILALARALVPGPWLLLLDEPSEGIQPSIVQEIGTILASLRARQGLAMIIVEQNLELVLDVADRILVLERGRVIDEMSADVVRGGALTDLLGMGTARAARVGPARPAVAPGAEAGQAGARAPASAGQWPPASLGTTPSTPAYADAGRGRADSNRPAPAAGARAQSAPGAGPTTRSPAGSAGVGAPSQRAAPATSSGESCPPSSDPRSIS